MPIFYFTGPNHTSDICYVTCLIQENTPLSLECVGIFTIHFVSHGSYYAMWEQFESEFIRLQDLFNIQQQGLFKSGVRLGVRYRTYNSWQTVFVINIICSDICVFRIQIWTQPWHCKLKNNYHQLAKLALRLGFKKIFFIYLSKFWLNILF